MNGDMWIAVNVTTTPTPRAYREVPACSPGPHVGVRYVFAG